MKKILLSILLAFGLVSAYGQTDGAIHYDSTMKITIRKLLIISSGPMSSRKIAQDLKYALDKHAKQNGYATSLTHLGDISNCTNENIQIASKANPHDAILVITPESVTDSTKDYVRPTLAYNLILRDFSRPLRKRRTKEFSTQLSTFILVDDINARVPLWYSEMEISTNLGSAKYFDHLAETLVSKWNARMINLGS